MISTSLVLTLVICSGFQFVLGNNLGNKTNSTDSLLDDRINLNFNYAASNARNPDGSYSASDASSYGFKAGILYPGGNYNPIASQSGSKANTYSGGRRPPSTSANAGNQVGPGGIRGSANAGYQGGQGNAWAGSQSQQIAIPLGDGFGGVLLSNLRPINETGTKSSNETENSGPSPTPVAKKNPDSLVFN